MTSEPAVQQGAWEREYQRRLGAVFEKLTGKEAKLPIRVDTDVWGGGGGCDTCGYGGYDTRLDIDLWDSAGKVASISEYGGDAFGKLMRMLAEVPDA